MREDSLKSRGRGPVVDHSTVMMTADEFSGGSKPVSEAGENDIIPMKDRKVARAVKGKN